MKDKEYRDYDEREGNGKALDIALSVTMFIVLVLVVGFAIIMASCTTTKYVPVETVRTEYKDNIREVHTTDSVTDTRFIYVKGDTLIDYRDRVKWRDRYIHDSVFIEKSDTIREPYPVEKPLTKWQQTKMDLGGMAIGSLGIIILAFFIWLIFKIRRKI